MSILAWPDTVLLGYVSSWNLASLLAVRILFGKHWVSSLQQVFTWGAAHAEVKHPSLTPGTGDWESLGLRGT